MALPTITSLSEDAFTSVPRSLVEGAAALGADRWQTLLTVVGPAARSGLFAAAMLGMGRAIGETMTVLMATGNVSAMPSGFLDPVRTLTATIAIELGEVAQGTTHYRMLFGVGLLLFLLTLGVNLLADFVQRRGARGMR
jgi:phosphate transport system permease protein